MIARDIRSNDGLVLAGYEYGNRHGPEILFIHGFSQCSLAGTISFLSSTSNDFRLIALIFATWRFRKPVDISRYADDRLFADDVHNVMEASG